MTSVACKVTFVDAKTPEITIDTCYLVIIPEKGQGVKLNNRLYLVDEVIHYLTRGFFWDTQEIIISLVSGQ